MENEGPLRVSSPHMSEKSATSESRQGQVSAQPNRILSILRMKWKKCNNSWTDPPALDLYLPNNHYTVNTD